MSGPSREARRTWAGRRLVSPGPGSQALRRKVAGDSSAGGEESGDERSRSRVTRIEPRRQVGDASSDGAKGGPRKSAASSRRGRGVVAEERAASERTRCVDAATPVAGEKGAGARIQQRQPPRVAWGDSDGPHGVTDLLDLDGGGKWLAPDDRDVAAVRHLSGARRAAARPAFEETVGLGVERKELGSLGGTGPRPRHVSGRPHLTVVWHVRHGRPGFA